MFSTWQRGDIPPCHVENILQVVVDVAKGGHPSLPRQMPLQGVFDMAKEEHPSLLRRTHLRCVFKGGTPSTLLARHEETWSVSGKEKKRLFILPRHEETC